MLRRIRRSGVRVRDIRAWLGAATVVAMLAGGAVCGSPQSVGLNTPAPGATGVATVAAATTVTAAGTPDPGGASPTDTPTVLPATPTTHSLTPISIARGLFGDGITTSTLTPTNGWKNYTNAAYGFSFQYPSDWQLSETDSTGHYGPHGEPSYPLHSVTVENPEVEQGEKIPGGNCSHEPETCIGATPNLLAFNIAINRPPTCHFTGAIGSDQVTVAGVSTSRCASEFPNDHSRGASIPLPLASGDVIELQFAKGNQVQPAGQAVLETILATFRRTSESQNIP